MAFLGYTQKNASTLGNRLGADLGGILEGLAQQKAQSVKVNNNRQLLNSLGINPQISSQLAHKDDDFIGNFLKQFEGFDIGNQNQGYQAAPQNYQQNMAGLTPQQQERGYSQNQPNLPANQIEQQSPGISDMVRGLYAANPGLESQISPEQLGQLIQNQSNQQALRPNGNNQQAQSSIKSKSSTSTAINEGEKLQIKEAQQKAQEVIEKGSIAERNLKILDEYEHILKTGKISSGTKHVLGKYTGTSGDITTDDTQVLGKLSEQLIPPARTDAELRSFQNRVPNPGQSKGAQLRLVKSLKQDLKNDAKQARVANDILNKNGGIAPIGFNRMLSSKIGTEELENDISQAPEGFQLIGEFNNINEVKAQEGDILEGSDGSKYKFSQGQFRKVS